MRKALVLFLLLTGCSKKASIEFSAMTLEWKAVASDGVVSAGRVYPNPENAVPQGGERLYASLTLENTVTSDLWTCVVGGSASFSKDWAMSTLFLKQGTILTGKWDRDGLWAYGVPGAFRLLCKEYRQTYKGGF